MNKTLKLELKNNIKQVKQIFKIAKNEDQIYQSMEILYNRISNKPYKRFTKKYNLQEILTAPTIKLLTYQPNKKIGNGVVIEFVNYAKAQNNLAMLYNEFENAIQTKLEIYITKEKQNEKNL